MSKLSGCFVLGFTCLIFAFANAGELENKFSTEVDFFPLSENALEVNIGLLIDENLSAIRKALLLVDPVQIQDVSLLGRGRLTEGLLNNLSLLHRTGKCTLKYENKLLIVDINVGWEDISFNYDYYFKLLFIQRAGKLRGSVDSLRINLSVTIDLENYAVFLQKLKFTNVGKYNVELEGTFGDKLRTWIARIIMNLSKNLITRAIEKVTSKTLQSMITEFNKKIPHHPRQFVLVDLVKLSRNEED